jgi:hypothetical protein
MLVYNVILTVRTRRYTNLKIKERIRVAKKALKEHNKKEKGPFYTYLILRGLVILVMIAQFFNHNYENVFLCILTLIMLMVPNFIEMQFHIELPNGLEITMLMFIFSAEILGEIQEYYITFPFWDTMLHTINGFLAAAIGFSLVDILNRNEKIKFNLSPFFVAMVAFCFSMTIGVLWEFFEFGMDTFFHFDMQKDTILTSISTILLDPSKGNHTVIVDNISNVSINGKDLGLKGYLDIGLIDTMQDLIVNFIGAVVISAIGFVYVKKRGKSPVADQFIVKISEQNKAAE